MDAKALGHWAEECACNVLQQHGWLIIKRNYHSRYGEIDVIAMQGQELIFVEVKARSNSRYGKAIEMVGQFKQEKLYKTAQVFLQQHPQFEHYYCRFDVICIDVDKSCIEKFAVAVQPLQYQLEWIENAFTM